MTRFAAVALAAVAYVAEDVCPAADASVTARAAPETARSLRAESFMVPSSNLVTASCGR
jgi:hypothetical protein